LRSEHRDVEREDVAPLRFAQGVGFGFAVVGVLGYATGLTGLGIVATAFALAAAFLNAAFAFCLGCETYLLIRRFTPTKESSLQ
jgi:zinc transporter ZupT